MSQAFIITLREGLEAFLIVAISLAYLRKTGREQLVPAVRWGIGLSIVISIAAVAPQISLWRSESRIGKKLDRAPAKPELVWSCRYSRRSAAESISVIGTWPATEKPHAASAVPSTHP